MEEIEQAILQNREALNIHECAFLKSNQVTFAKGVRSLCERNACGMYGKSWACPPGAGSVEHCAAQCGEFQNAMVFTSRNPLREKHDVKEWIEAGRAHEAITEKVAGIFRAKFDKVLVLSTEGCMVCESCAYPNQECRFPERMFPAVESFGLDVGQLAMTSGVKYFNGPNTVTYFSLVFF